MMNIIKEFWYIFGFIILLGLYYLSGLRKSNKDYNSYEFNLKIGFLFLICLIINKLFFTEHLFFFISMIIFIPIWVLFIHWLLSRDDVYIFETSMIGDEFINIDEGKKIIINNTSHRLLVMPREIYNTKKHIGDLHYNFWAGSERIKFTDYYDDKNNVFYHPPLPELHNFSFYAIKGFWLKLKSDIPKIIDENTTLTLMSDWYIAFKMHTIKNNIDEHLKSINTQHKHNPFTIPHNLDDIYKRILKDKLNDIAVSEQLKTDDNKKESDIGGK